MAKELYFVRHGLTVANEKNSVQGFDDPLSDRGLEQAEVLADRLTRISFGKLLASDMLRTRQTTEIIAKKTGHEPEFSALFREVQYPASYHNLSHEDPRILEYWDMQKQERQTNLHWKLEDEESLGELMKRVDKGFIYAAEQAEESVVVITHGLYLRMTVLYKLLGEDMPNYWNDRNSLLKTSNTGLTLFRKRDDGGDPEWQLLTWNDHAHLG